MEMLAIFCVLRCTRVISNVNMNCGVVASRKKYWSMMINRDSDVLISILFLT